MHVTQRLKQHACDSEGFLLCRASNTDGRFMWHARVWMCNVVNVSADWHRSEAQNLPSNGFHSFFSPRCHHDRRQPLKYFGDPWGQRRCKNSFTRSFFSIHESVKRDVHRSVLICSHRLTHSIRNSDLSPRVFFFFQIALKLNSSNSFYWKPWIYLSPFL